MIKNSTKALPLYAKLYRNLNTSLKVFKEPVPTLNSDWVGPADPDSNIRKIIYSKSTSDLETFHHKQRTNDYIWNDMFWREHNKKFFHEKSKFLETFKSIPESGNDASDSLSVFYKKFLEENKNLYDQYNREWYRRNFYSLMLSFRVALSNLFSNSKL
ncbi:COA8 family protein CBG23705, mitochondrial-like isoform X1 [Hydra vulgaris]|uniref:UPF0671 protein C14orf153 n=1 Tax=Hydra vulgaris TaxID=6087 RepID=T2M6Y2_HYDVU